MIELVTLPFIDNLLTYLALRDKGKLKEGYEVVEFNAIPNKIISKLGLEWGLFIWFLIASVGVIVFYKLGCLAYSPSNVEFGIVGMYATVIYMNFRTLLFNKKQLKEQTGGGN